uniref:Uncharacterized protein n=1 Tax=Rhizophora mucronata TaxID=61149 RepID=A0A2P2PN66_RHIMU
MSSKEYFFVSSLLLVVSFISCFNVLLKFSAQCSDRLEEKLPFVIHGSCWRYLLFYFFVSSF